MILNYIDYKFAIMSKEKSFEELLNSILNLINDAKVEYENFVKKDFTNVDHLHDKRILQKEIVHETESKVFQTVQENKSNKKSKVLSNWQNINFKKTIKSSNNEVKKILNIETKFNKLMEEWINKNLKRIIELEFSQYIKKSKD